MTEAQQNDWDEVIELPETTTGAEYAYVVSPANHVVIPPAPPMPKPELVGEMPPLKWRKKFMQRKLRKQGKNRLTRRSRTL